MSAVERGLRWLLIGRAGSSVSTYSMIKPHIRVLRSDGVGKGCGTRRKGEMFLLRGEGCHFHGIWMRHGDFQQIRCSVLLRTSAQTKELLKPHDMGWHGRGMVSTAAYTVVGVMV